MNRKTLGIIIATIFALAIALGLLQRPQNPFIRENQPPAASNKDLKDYYEEARGLAKSQQQTSTTTFLAVGDISLSRNIAQTIKAKNDLLYPFRGMEEQFRGVDFTFGNLETPFSKSEAFTPKNTLIFNAPKANVAGLKEYNFKVLNLANNHAFDQGFDGVTTTRQILAENEILFTGTGESLDEAWMPAVYEVNGIKIGFIGASYSSVNDGGKATNTHVARIEDTERLKSSIVNLKSSVDFLVVTMHAGTEYVRNPNLAQINFAHAAIDAGADIVIGHHSHWIQTIEEYCPSVPSPCKYIFYSLGNFIFDQNWSQDTMEGLVLKINLSKQVLSPGKERDRERSNTATIDDIQSADTVNQGSRPVRHSLGDGGTPATLDSIELIPIIIKENCCPSPALSVEAQAILKKIGVTTGVIPPITR